MNELLTFLTMWLTDLLVLGTALLAIGCLAVAVLRQAAVRMALARGTLLGLAALCVLTALPGWPRQPLASLTLNHLAEEEGDVALQAEPSFNSAPVVVENPLPISDSSLSTTQKSPTFAFIEVVKLLPLVWLGTAGLAMIYMIVGAWRAVRLLQTAEKAPDWSQQELERLVANAKSGTPRLKTSERIATAIALLAWRPHILLAAASVREENKAAVRAALAHEWAHIRHGDLWLLALERLLLPLFCLHPLFWVLRRQIRIDQELLADAAAAGDARVEYAEALMSWAKAENSTAAPRWGIAALSLWEHPSNLSRRVEMLLHPQASVASNGSRLWKWLAPMSLLASVLGLSLVTLRPAAVAQDDVVVEIEIQPRPDKVKKTKKEKPKKSEAKRTGDQVPLPVEAGEIILMEMLIGQVEHAALERAESSLGDLIQAASEDHCRLEGNLIVADLSAEQFSKLTDELKKANALTILSRPRVTTIDGQEASLQVGSAIPLVRLEKTVNGEPRRRVDFQNVGETIVICPHTNDQDPSHLTLDVTATHTELDKRSELRTGDDTPRFTKHQIKLAVEASVGKTLVVTEREPKKGSGRVHSILLAIGPQKLPPPAPEPAPSAATKASQTFFGSTNDLERLRDENSALRKQVDDLKARLIDLEVQIRWLRAAAAPGGKEKVSDEVFLRRVYLDLTGLIPTAEETRAFLNDKDERKRNKLIDKLLEGVATRKDTSLDWKRLREAIASRSEAQPAPTRSAPEANPGIDSDADSLQVFHLANSSADAIAQMLAKVFPNDERLRVAVEERTNSLIVRGSPKTLEKVKPLLELLDRKPDSKADAKDPATRKKGASLRELKEADLQAAQSTLQAAKAKKGVETAKLRELELQDAEAGLRSAERVLAHAEKLAGAKGFLSDLERARVRADADAQRVILENAKLRLKKAQEEKPNE